MSIRTRYWKGIKITKTFQYLFEPSLLLYHNEDVRGILTGYLSGVRIINVFLGDTAHNTHEPKDGVFYILCDLTNKYAMEQLKKIQKSQYYKDMYIINLEPMVAVIMFQGFRGTSLEAFLSSNYSNMFSAPLLESLKSRFQMVNDQGKLDYMHAYKVLSNSDELRQEMLTRLDLEATPERLKQLASKINLEEEIVDIKQYYHEHCKN